jgi:hypothetical protein
MCNVKSKEKVRLKAQDVRFIRPAAGYRLFQEVIYDIGEVAKGVGTYLKTWLAKEIWAAKNRR